MDDLINSGLVDTLNWHIARGRQNPDPRLVFDLSAAELNYMARLSQDLREEYKFFRIALKWDYIGYDEGVSTCIRNKYLVLHISTLLVPTSHYLTVSTGTSVDTVSFDDYHRLYTVEQLPCIHF
jgi:hypothetical protein